MALCLTYVNLSVFSGLIYKGQEEKGRLYLLVSRDFNLSPSSHELKKPVTKKA